MKNHLRNATSPYLMQHAGNPVEWYPWDEEAINLAKEHNKPVLLSIGYAACHWCHVMAHESFEDPETAAIMNKHFVCIKVDREERPDLDQIYMTFVQMTTGSGGWPLNVFLTPDLEPFYGGTYFPPEDRYGRPSWKKILYSVSKFYREDKTALNDNLHKIRQAFELSLEEKPGDALPAPDDLNHAARELADLYDQHNGGFGQAPKFPAVQVLTFLLAYYHRTGDPEYLQIVTHSLNKMARGGIYDQIGGGFSRYAVDDQWRIPHFEKMLYDNAQLAVLYTEAYQITRDPYFREITRGILAFVGSEMRHDDGGFYSSLDADSEGIEGRYYVWDKPEIDAALGDRSNIFCAYFGITGSGNFEGKNIPYVSQPIGETAKKFGKTTAEIEEILRTGIKKLKNIRDKRIRPGLDNKILTSWNALMLSAFARAYQVFGDHHYKDILEQNIRFIQKNLLLKNRLYRSFNHGQARLAGYLDDYAYLIQGLIDAYETVFEQSYLELAYDLLKDVNRRYYDHEKSGYFYTANEHQNLIYKMKDLHDQSIPSANGVMLQNLLRMHTITADQDLLTLAEQMMQGYLPDCRRNPYAFGSFLIAMDYYLTRPIEIVIVTRDDHSFKDLLKPLFETYFPHRHVIILHEQDPMPLISNTITTGKTTIGGKATAFICRDFTCSQPVTLPEDLELLLRTKYLQK